MTDIVSDNDEYDLIFRSVDRKTYGVCKPIDIMDEIDDTTIFHYGENPLRAAIIRGIL